MAATPGIGPAWKGAGGRSRTLARDPSLESTMQMHRAYCSACDRPVRVVPIPVRMDVNVHMESSDDAGEADDEAAEAVEAAEADAEADAAE